MKVVINALEYDVEIVRKRNKNTYIRIKDNHTFLVTTSLFTTKGFILKLFRDNESNLQKMMQKMQRKTERQTGFYYLGQKYDIIELSTLQKITMEEGCIYTPSIRKLELWFQKEAKELFSKRLADIHSLFEEKIPYPILKVRKMKSKWGVCNRKNQSITLNLELMKKTMMEIDYVIVHELSHFVHFDHSKSFWHVVAKYCPNYKQIHKLMKE